MHIMSYFDNFCTRVKGSYNGSDGTVRILIVDRRWPSLAKRPMWVWVTPQLAAFRAACAAARRATGTRGPEQLT